jgi:hypothetical protein
MTEELVTLETAKLLKEKGFDERTLYAYKNDGTLYKDGDRIKMYYNTLPVPELCEKYLFCNGTCLHCNLSTYLISSPPQSVAQKWLRETKNLHICVYNCAYGYGYGYEISKADNGTHIACSTYKRTNDGGKWGTYEEALEAGLQEALKLI